MPGIDISWNLHNCNTDTEAETERGRAAWPQLHAIRAPIQTRQFSSRAHAEELRVYLLAALSHGRALTCSNLCFDKMTQDRLRGQGEYCYNTSGK